MAKVERKKGAAMMGRPPKPIAQKVLEGTYREDRDGERAAAERAIVKKAAVIFPDGSKVSCPKTIKTKYVKAYWRHLTAMLQELHVLSPADLPQIETLCITLEKMRAVQVAWEELTPFDDAFDIMQKRYLALSNKFDSIASKYYISPQARTRLKIEELTAVKAQIDVAKEQSAIGQILGGRV